MNAGADAGDHSADADARDASLARLEAIVESSVDGIIGATADGIVTDWNPAAERIYGYPAAEIVGRPLREVVPAEGGEAWEALMTRLRAGERIERFETERVRKDGKRIRVSLSLAPLHDRIGMMVGFSAIVRDVTDLAEVEHQRIELEASRLRHSDRLETASRLAGGIAHDFNNILTAANDTLPGAYLLGSRPRHRARLPMTVNEAPCPPRYPSTHAEVTASQVPRPPTRPPRSRGDLSDEGGCAQRVAPSCWRRALPLQAGRAGCSVRWARPFAAARPASDRSGAGRSWQMDQPASLNGHLKAGLDR